MSADAPVPPSDPTDRERPSEFDHALLYIAVFDKAHHRTALGWLKRQAWWVSESGPFGWIGDRFDDLEALSSRVAARRHMKREARRVG